MTQNSAYSIQTYVQTAGQLLSDMNGEKVMMSIQNGKYYNLGEVGGKIWGLLDIPRTAEQIATKLIEQYEVTLSECVDQVDRFLQSLAKEQLVQVSSRVLD